MKMLDMDHTASIAVILMSELGKCLSAGKRHKLPSLKQGAVWTAFHRLRSRVDVSHAWSAFIATNVPASHQNEPELAMQMILDRGLKKMISNISEGARLPPQTSSVKPLTTKETNAVRYMAGYVAVKLLKRYRRTYKNPHVLATKAQDLCPCAGRHEVHAGATRRSGFPL